MGKGNVIAFENKRMLGLDSNETHCVVLPICIVRAVNVIALFLPAI
jgi:hypothetical protein